MLNFVFNDSKQRFESFISDCNNNSDDFLQHKNALSFLYYKWDNSEKVYHCARKDFPEKNEKLRLLETFDNYKIHPSASDELEEIKTEYVNDMEYYRRAEYDEDIISDKIKLRNFQKEDILNFIKRNAHLNLNDAGLGKTIEEIYYISYLHKNNMVDGSIILTRSHLLNHWKNEILEMSKVFKEEDIKVFYLEDRFQPYEDCKDKKILIIPHDYYKNTILSYRKDYKKKRSWKHIRWKNEAVVKEKWGKENISITIDESHWFKKAKSIKTKAIMYRKDQYKFRSMATASLSPNYLPDYYSQCKFISNNFIAKTAKEFEYYLSQSFNFKRDVTSSFNIEKCNKFMDSLPYISVRTLKEDLPEMEFKRIPYQQGVALHKIQKELYKRLKRTVLVDMSQEYSKIYFKEFEHRSSVLYELLDNPLLLKNRKEYKENLYADEKIIPLIDKWKYKEDPKLKWLEGLVSDYVVHGGEKLIIYCTHPDTNDMLQNHFKDIKKVAYHGKMKVKDTTRHKNEIIDQFNNDPDTKLAIYSSLSLSDGANHHTVCNRVIIYEIPFDSVQFIQLRDRTHRLVSTKDTFIYYPKYKETIDEYRIRKMLSRSKLNDLINKEISPENLKMLLEGKYYLDF